MVLTPFDREMISTIIGTGEVISLHKLVQHLGMPYRYAYMRARRLETFGIISIRRMEHKQGRPLVIKSSINLGEANNGTNTRFIK